ncbi:hypothetical protein BD311DRAFT_804632 [Dichomitus squalens]|uniref:Uncharacterized protein n=1 Tax=Dichomitus squalens TaxID=114155 RepID=A0A4V2K154_9APHY|nr:hypothetical protein BD311DRAFT_804632 [Dichomitus squalens]
MERRATGTPRIVCTGYEFTDVLRKYLEVGHGVNFAKQLARAIEQDARPSGVDLEDDEEDLVDEEDLALQRETATIMTYRTHFSRVRRRAPPEVRKTLEIPYMYTKWVKRGSGLRTLPPEADVKAIQDFINVANSLLPEAMRDEAGFKIEDMHLKVHHPGSLIQPAYKQVEREELLPPRHLRAFMSTLQ